MKIYFPEHHKIYNHLPNKQGVYMLRNGATHKGYIGISLGAKGIRNRVADHLRKLRQQYHENEELQHDWNCNDSKWTCIVLELTDDETREEFYIRKYKSHLKEFGYNKHIGKVISDETKIKMSKAQLGVPKSETHKQHMRGRIMSQETRLKMSIAKRKKDLTTEVLFSDTSR